MPASASKKKLRTNEKKILISKETKIIGLTQSDEIVVIFQFASKIATIPR